MPANGTGNAAGPVTEESRSDYADMVILRDEVDEARMVAALSSMDGTLWSSCSVVLERGGAVWILVVRRRTCHWFDVLFKGCGGR